MAALSGPYDVTGAGRLPEGGVVLRLEGLPGSVESRAKALSAALKPYGHAEVVQGDADFATLRDFAMTAQGPLWRIVLRPSQAEAMLAQLPGRHAVDLQTLGLHDALAYIQLAVDAVKCKTFAENIAKIEADTARQALQTDESEQFTGTGIEFEKLPLAGIQFHVPIERRKIKRGR